jgi:hypothetical protein
MNAEGGHRGRVEARLAADPVVGAHFAPAAWLPLGTGREGYVLLRAR